MNAASRRVHPAAPQSGATVAVQDADFACAYKIETAAGDIRSSQQLARTAWEGAPAALRWFMLAGWRLVLGLRLGPRSSPNHILGWRIIEDRADATECHSQSWLLTACNIFRVVDGQVVWSTLVVYERPIAKLIWPPVALLHRALVRRALLRASSWP